MGGQKITRSPEYIHDKHKGDLPCGNISVIIVRWGFEEIYNDTVTRVVSQAEHVGILEGLSQPRELTFRVLPLTVQNLKSLEIHEGTYLIHNMDYIRGKECLLRALRFRKL